MVGVEEEGVMRRDSGAGNLVFGGEYRAGEGPRKGLEIRRSQIAAHPLLIALHET
jgi:hypothetical protein